MHVKLPIANYLFAVGHIMQTVDSVDDKTLSEVADLNRKSSSDSEPGIGDRFKQLVDLFSGRKDAAEAAGITRDMLYRYIRAESQPSMMVAARLCVATGVDPLWLAFGDRPMRAIVPTTPVDNAEFSLELLQQAIELVEELFQDRRVKPPAGAKARVVSAVYELLQKIDSTRSSREEIKRIVGALTA